MLHEIEDKSGNDIGHNQYPPNHRDPQEIMNHAIPDEQGPEITQENSGDRRKAGNHEP